MSGRYAAGTDVPVDRSKAELERLLVRYGATSFAYAWESRQIMIGFRMGKLMYRVRLPMPPVDSKQFTHTPTGKERSTNDAVKEFQREERRRWRALILVIKAKLEAVDSGVTTFEDEFLSSVILPNGQTVIDHLGPQLIEVYRTNTMPSLLPGMNPPQLGDGR